MWLGWIVGCGTMEPAPPEPPPPPPPDYSHHQAVVSVTDPAVLDRLQEGRFAFGRALGDAGNAAHLAALVAQSPRYRSLADLVGQPIEHDANDQLPADLPSGLGDIPEMVRTIRGIEDTGARSSKDRTGGFFIRHLSNNANHPYLVESDGDEPRHFDARWLRSEHARMDLVGVVNRVDRRDLYPDTCGEVRLVYRLSYATPDHAASLPFFALAVHRYGRAEGEDCQSVAQRWMIPNDVVADPMALADALVDGPLADWSLTQVELNLQSLRFTSGYMHDFGGQAMYIQRILAPSGDELAPIPLENTPDVQAVLADPSLMQRFVDVLRTPEALAELDAGTLNLDIGDGFLATQAVSWSTLGRARRANKPFATLFDAFPTLLASIDIGSLTYIQSHAALVERLDNLSCMGCHQTSGTAGFHHLGEPKERYSHRFNRQAQNRSPHARADAPRRQAFVRALANGDAPTAFRPHSGFPSGTEWPTPTFEPVPVRHVCTTPEHFADAPPCASHQGRPTECRATVTHAEHPSVFGECVLATQAEPSHYFAGGACWTGTLQESGVSPDAPTYNFLAFRDKLTGLARLHDSLGSGGARYGCSAPKGGAPLGRRQRRCSLAEEQMTVLDAWGPTSPDLPDEICANQGGNGFDVCAATGDSGACLESRVARGMLDTCDDAHPCREDYICQQLPDYTQIAASDYTRKRFGKQVNRTTPDAIDGTALAALRDRGVGFCAPTYFLFNMRVDGHPSPVTGRPAGIPSIDRSRPLRGYPQ